MHLGEVYHGRFEVVHKLGYGGFSTVWLCLDRHNHQWRAVKFIIADGSTDEESDLRLLAMLCGNGVSRNECEENHLTLPIDSFWVNGVNGRHLCLVLPLLGCPISSKSIQDSSDSFKQIFRQTGKALQFLHRQGICHGDITPKNVLFHLEDTAQISREEMISLIGEPEMEEVRTFERGKPCPRYPSYVVEPADLSRLRSKDDISVIDFGECFKVSDPPKFIGTPNMYAAPEIRLPSNPGFSGDVWALACMIVEVRIRSRLFHTGVRTGDLIAWLWGFLGPLPEPYRSIRVKQLEKVLEDIGEDDDIESIEERKLAEEQLGEISDQMVERPYTTRVK